MAIISQPSGDPFIVNSDPTGFQDDAEAARLTNGYVVVWHDTDEMLGNHRILARMYDADGTPGPAFEVLDDTSGIESELSVVALSDGGFVVFHTGAVVDGSSTGIEGQRVDASGTLVGDPFQVNTHTNSVQKEPDAVLLNNGNLAVVWDSFVFDDRFSYGIAGQILTTTGTSSDPDFVVNTTVENGQTDASIAALATGGFVVTWLSEDRDIYAQRFDGSGSKLGPEFLVNSGVDPDVVALSGGGFAVFFTQSVNTPGLGTISKIAVRFYDSGGAPVGSEIRLDGGHDFDSYRPSATQLSNGDLLVMWGSDGLRGTGAVHPPGLYVQRLSATGELIGDEVLVNDDPLVSAAGGDYLTALSDGSAIATFTVANGSGPAWHEVAAQLLTSVEVPDGSGSGTIIGTPGSDELNGTEGDDQIEARGGDDVIFANGGNDLLLGEAGDDTLQGGEGDDTLDGGAGNDDIWGGSGTDTARFNVASTEVSGGLSGAIFTLVTSEGTDSVREVEFFEFTDRTLSLVDLLDLVSGGGTGPIEGTPEADVLNGTAGDDTILGLDGNDRLIGDTGNDSMDGGLGADTLNGGDGDDIIIGGPGADDLRDIVYAGEGNDSVDAGAGNDLVYGQGGNDTIAGGFGVDEVQGQDGDDVITGSAFSDLVFGGAGNDFVNGGFGHDRINGGTGADKFYHLGIFDHGSDWVQDYNAAEGDVLLFGNAAATRADFQVNFDHTASAEGERAGDDAVQEAFVIYRPTGQIMWALVDGQGQSSINLQIGGDVFDLLA
ncbi:hypothetical protein OEZ49_02015 [Ruegeria sp. WL0004]|uniref:Calcium-binding protein n=1 Tax=Ruegeria marisflavi TaxID=2984152 RepID=A0ABT2WKV1_9RHOB|nr:hypothetical protein [Ruegeria sp. WL0004]MCU9836531.1 hypothetical protein [Ruegeria sp. WL0004]